MESSRFGSPERAPVRVAPTTNSIGTTRAVGPVSSGTADSSNCSFGDGFAGFPIARIGLSLHVRALRGLVPEP